MKHLGFLRDIALVGLSIMISVLLVQTDALNVIFQYTEGMRLVTAFFAGMFFVSIFTATPALVILLKIFSVGSTFDVVLAATVGSLVGDMVILSIIKDEIGKYLIIGLKKIGQSKIIRLFKIPIVRFFTRIFGALVIMSPFPDELGIALMGVSRLKRKNIATLLFVLDFVGLYIIALVA
ncbi:MAG: hypothetical protein WC757_01340 [Candidatus Paceibacterota bacterium]|jgi:hypothetical protein